jgi:hypothetical protein
MNIKETDPRWRMNHKVVGLGDVSLGENKIFFQKCAFKFCPCIQTQNWKSKILQRSSRRQTTGPGPAGRAATVIDDMHRSSTAVVHAPRAYAWPISCVDACVRLRAARPFSSPCMDGDNFQRNRQLSYPLPGKTSQKGRLIYPSRGNGLR